METKTMSPALARVMAVVLAVVAWANAKTDELLAMFGMKSLRKDQRAESALGDIAIGGILTILSFVIVLAFWPVLTGAINTAQDDGNTDSTAGTILGLIPLTFAAALLISGIVFLVKGVRQLS